MTTYCVAHTKDKSIITEEYATKTIERSFGMAKKIKDRFLLKRQMLAWGDGRASVVVVGRGSDWAYGGEF